jgi:hypothetical protein
MRAFYLLLLWPPRARADRLTAESLFKADDEEILRPIRPGAFARWAAERDGTDPWPSAAHRPSVLRRRPLPEGS